MFMLISASLILIACGGYCVTDTDSAWRFYEWDCRNIGMTPPRLKNWRLRVKQLGYGLIALGLLGFTLGLNF